VPFGVVVDNRDGGATEPARVQWWSEVGEKEREKERLGLEFMLGRR